MDFFVGQELFPSPVLFCLIFCSKLSVGNPFLNHVHIRAVLAVCIGIFLDCQISSFNQLFLVLPESFLAHVQILTDFVHRWEACVPGPDAFGKVRIDCLRFNRQIPIAHHHSRNDATSHR